MTISQTPPRFLERRPRTPLPATRSGCTVGCSRSAPSSGPPPRRTPASIRETPLQPIGTN